MFSKRNENIFTSVLPLYYFSKIIGVFSPSFVGLKQKGIFRFKIFDKVIFLVALSALFVLLVRSILNENHVLTSSSTFLVQCWEFCSSCGLASSFIAMIHHKKYSNEMINILKMLHEFDEKVNLRFKPRLKLRLKEKYLVGTQT